jgi:hypothetical protein
MASPLLAALRNKLLDDIEKKTRVQTSTTNSLDNTIYAHWNIPENSTAVVRFLPDKNPENVYFWIERQMIKLSFPGVIGRHNSKPVEVQVPCVEMWGDTCPVHAELRAWYKDESLKEMASKYWKKRSYFFQGFVRSNPWSEDKAPENPIRRFNINAQIFKIIQSSLMDTEFEEVPTDYMSGLDFNIKKTKKGNYADYSTSNWSRRESALSEFELEAIEKYGLNDLADYMPKRPNDTELKIIEEMFVASVDNQPYDLERWGAYYKPWGLNVNESETSGGSESTPTVYHRPAVKAAAEDRPPFDLDENEVVTATAPIEVPKSGSEVSSDKAQDILAMIRARQQAKA